MDDPVADISTIAQNAPNQIDRPKANLDAMIRHCNVAFALRTFLRSAASELP